MGPIRDQCGFLSAPRSCEKYLLSRDNGFLDGAFGNEWKIVREPGVDPAFKRANPGDSFGPQQQRHTGAGRFIGSGAVDDNIPIARNFMMALFQLLHRDAQRAGYHVRLRFDVDRLAQIDDHNRITGI